MGTQTFDQFALLHFATGIIFYFFGVSFWKWFWIHLSFEMLENMEFGMKIINDYLGNVWPGGKNYSDSYNNRLGDQISAMIGWYVAYLLDDYGSEHGWFGKHLTKENVKKLLLN